MQRVTVVAASLALLVIGACSSNDEEVGAAEQSSTPPAPASAEPTEEDMTPSVTPTPAPEPDVKQGDPSASPEKYRVITGETFTVQLLRVRGGSAQVRFCATAPYEGGPIPVTRGRWSMRDLNGNSYEASEAATSAVGAAYPLSATVGVGDCLEGWIDFNLPPSGRPQQIVYDSTLSGGPLVWKVLGDPEDKLEPEPKPGPEPKPELTVSQENAIESAKRYLDVSGFSKSGLIEQLEFEGYSTEDATFAVNNIDADWNEQAARAAEAYLDASSFSRSGLIEQLTFDGYTREQAEYGADQVGL